MEQQQADSEQPAQPITKSKKRFGTGTLLSVAVVVGLGAFVLGTRMDQLTLLVSASQNKGLTTTLNYTELQTVYDKLRQKYDGPLDGDKLIEGAKKGLVAAAEDPYTVYFTAKEAEEFSHSLEGTFSGIGAELDKRDSQIIIAATLDDSPARSSGLQANDKIVSVNGQDTAAWSIEQAVSKIRGEAGTSVKLTILRGQEVKEFSIIRAQITAPSVKWEVTADNIGYMRISQFNKTTTGLATTAAQEFKAKGVKGIVLDLRGNGGGYLSAAREVASLWLDDKVVVLEKRGDQVIDTLRSDTSPVVAGISTLVLVDGGSASASEIVAGALRDNGAARLVGVKTFGKGSVQDIVDGLPKSGELKVTIAKWYTPAGKNISAEGIAPDVEVSISDDDRKADRDPQKDKAFALVKQ